MSNSREPDKKNTAKKKRESEQTIRTKDRIQAAIRCPQYQKDWSTYSRKISVYASELSEHLQREIREEDLDPDDRADNPVAKKWNLPYAPHPLANPLGDFVHNLNTSNTRSCHLLEEQGPRYLDIRVYLESPAQDIQEGVMDLVNTYRELCGIKNRKPRPTNEVDIWKVYDMKSREGKNKMMIARALWPNDTLGNPRTDYKANTRRKQIARAVDRTSKIVKQVREEATKNKTHLCPHPKMFKHLSNLPLPFPNS